MLPPGSLVFRQGSFRVMHFQAICATQPVQSAMGQF